MKNTKLTLALIVAGVFLMLSCDNKTQSKPYDTDSNIFPETDHPDYDILKPAALVSSHP
ncbi:MAG: hypothetical protein HKN40_01170 [Winogradskyella sp.]|uniref:hypothetical protein n=1 Tax=Winogradskyella sp. TaxID=1883156 RepID=UPI00181B6588|nr:hypothetical protein [Winogradskyella sp.]